MGWLWLRMPAGNGKPAHWQSISYKGAGPRPDQLAGLPGVLKLKTDDGWVNHIDPNYAGAKPLRLKGLKPAQDWLFALAMGYALPTNVGWGFYHLQDLNWPSFQLVYTEYLPDDPTDHTLRHQYIPLVHSPFVAEYDLTNDPTYGVYTPNHTVGQYTLDLALLKAHLPANLPIAGARLTFAFYTDGGGNRLNTTPDEPRYRLWNTQGQQMQTSSDIIYKAQYNEFYWKGEFPGEQARYVTDGPFNPTQRQVAVGDFVTNVENSYDDGTGWRRVGRSSFRYFISLEEFEDADHLDFTLTIDRPADPQLNGSLTLRVEAEHIGLDILNYGTTSSGSIGG